jgi:hypothetical protein
VDDNNEQLEIVKQGDYVGLKNEDINLTEEKLMKFEYKFKSFNSKLTLKIQNYKICMISHVFKIQKILNYLNIRK